MNVQSNTRQLTPDKVVFVADYAAHYQGNFLSSLNSFEKALRERGIEVEYVFPEKAPFEKWGSDYTVRHVVHPCDFKPGSLAQTLRELMKDDEFTVVHTHFLSLRSLIAIRKALKGCNCQVVFHEHMRLDWLSQGSPSTLLKKALYRRTLKDCKAVAVSSAVRDDLVAVLGSSENVYLVKNAISFDRLDDSGDQKAEGYDSGRDILIFGTHFMRKGVDIALRAMQISDCNLRLIVLATNKEDAISRLQQLDPSWQDYCVVRHVVQDISSVYRSVLCFISPSRSEAFGYAVAEAAYCGAQVIASDVPGQNTMKDIPNISWVAVDDAAALSVAIETCLERSNTGSSLLAKQRVETKAYVKENYGLSSWVNEMLGVYGVK